MGKEIERKFLVEAGWRPPGSGTAYEQGYICNTKERTVRVRIEGAAAKLTIKGATVGVSRSEYEYEVPVADAEAMLRDLCEQPTIKKRRHLVEHAGHTWEVDVFEGDNAGLVVAELELADESEPFEKPPWLRKEVSDDPRYYNASLVKHPFTTW